ncbi:acyl-CoA thioester hydrolase [Herbihabitans rhizosphaerae]|uniref:Acyl-CoA thioester hydrolase n=2 Tax=Herbihabitans rhizosphaerae TaxID=1872711 RepID=A0A4Q7KDT4_9PSEU|nr:acyl-CoA thioester hydrolase [Herbihabitans rhizosphaerae]
MDAFGHVNHANMVTLLEEARVGLLFGEAARQGAGGMADGVVVARLVVDYHAPLRADGSPVRIELVVSDVRAAAFTIDYTVHSGLSTSDTVTVTAETMMVPYNTSSARPRRLTDAERTFLTAWTTGDDGA